jgi:hypothetical protein
MKNHHLKSLVSDSVHINMRRAYGTHYVFV